MRADRRELAAIFAGGFPGAVARAEPWMFESHRLGEDNRVRAGALNIAVSLAAGTGRRLAGAAGGRGLVAGTVRLVARAVTAAG